MAHTIFEPLTTDRLIIRPIRKGDREDFFAYRSHPEVTKFQSFRPAQIEDIDAFILQMESALPNIPGQWYQAAICLKKGGRMIGDAGMHFIDGEQVEIGYTLSPDHQGKGYAAEAVHAVLGYLFGILGKHRVFASVDPDNTHSIALLERLGFRKEAHFHESIREGKRWMDDCIYAMLKREWDGRHCFSEV